MTITREQVADLQPGDVVELTVREFEGASVIVRGPLVARDDRPSAALFVGDYCVRDRRGDSIYGERRSLAVVSRAPRPLYVNHPRTEPVPGDVVRDADSDDPVVWMRATGVNDRGIWLDDIRVMERDKLPARLCLLVDGETGQVVP